MRTDDYDLRRTGDRRLGCRRFSGGGSLLAAGNFRFDIVTGLSADLVALSASPQSGTRKRVFNKIGSRIEFCVMLHVALADFSRKLLHIGTKLSAQNDFIRRERLRLGNILPGHPHSKPPK